jgi:hypothetical protein
MVELAEQHRQLIDDSAISAEVAGARGYWTATRKAELEVLGFKRFQQSVPALVIPIRDARGEIVTYQIRPDQPRIAGDGRPVKYETPATTRPAMDVPPGARGLLGSSISPLWITEGARKADAAVSAGLCCVSLPGVWSWARRLNGDARQVLPDLQRVQFEDRRVIVAFDSDAMTKPAVYLALKALADYLISRGALVEFLYLPELELGAKTGLDDFLAADHTVEDLWQHVEQELREPAVPKEKTTPALPTAMLLGYVGNLLRRYVHFPAGGEHQQVALMLYVLHTWAIDAAGVTPYIYVKSPTKRSGKTRLLEVLELCVRKPLRASSITEAAVFQAIEVFGPTMLIDEVDAIFRSRSERAEALRGVLNAGASRGAKVVRGTQDGTPAISETFGAKILAGIDTGTLPDTIRDRAITIQLERKQREERVERLRVRDLGDQPEELRRRLQDWATENVETLAAYRCELIPGISDRLEEAWEPLLAVAASAGPEWLDRARTAAVELAKGDDDGAGDDAELLLAAVFDVFGGREAIFTAELCARLNDDEELPFGGYRRGEGINGRGLARLLRRYEIRPVTIRLEGERAKGYRGEQFTDAWRRYTSGGEQDVPAEEGADGAVPACLRDNAGVDVAAEPKARVTDALVLPVTDPCQAESEAQSEEVGRRHGVTDDTAGDVPELAHTPRGCNSHPEPVTGCRYCRRIAEEIPA